MGISIADAAYAAGLFDGEGSVYFKRTKQKKHQRPGKPIHNVMVIRMEIAMTDKDMLNGVMIYLDVAPLVNAKLRKVIKDNGAGALLIEMPCMLLKFFGLLHKLNFTK